MAVTVQYTFSMLKQCLQELAQKNNSFLQDAGKVNGSLYLHVCKEAFYTAVHSGWKFSLHQDAGQSITAHKHLKIAFFPPPAAPVKSFYSSFISQVRLQ